VQRSCQASEAWLQNNCPIDIHDEPGSVGVVWDWQVFFWNVTSQPPHRATMAGLFQIYQQACLPASSCTGKDVRCAELSQAVPEYYGGDYDFTKYLQF